MFKIKCLIQKKKSKNIFIFWNHIKIYFMIHQKSMKIISLIHLKKYLAIIVTILILSNIMVKVIVINVFIQLDIFLVIMK